MIAWLPLAKSFLEEDKSISISERHWSQVCWFQNYNAHETIITLIQFILAPQNHEQVNIMVEEEEKYVLYHNQAFFSQERGGVLEEVAGSMVKVQVSPIIRKAKVFNKIIL